MKIIRHTINGKFLVAKNQLRQFDSITLEWHPGDPEYVKAIGYVYRGVNGENDNMLEYLNAWNDFVPYAIEREIDEKLAGQERNDVRWTYISEQTGGLRA
jgi:hypothetical protein